MTGATLKILLFAAAREAAGISVAHVDVALPTTVRDVRAALVARYPQLEPLASSCVFAVNAEYATEDALVAVGAELALIPPVSGG